MRPIFQLIPESLLILETLFKGMSLILPSSQQKTEAGSSPGRCWTDSSHGKYRVISTTWLKVKEGHIDLYGSHGFQFCDNYCHTWGKYYRKMLETKFMLIKKRSPRTTCR